MYDRHKRLKDMFLFPEALQPPISFNCLYKPSVTSAKSAGENHVIFNSNYMSEAHQMFSLENINNYFHISLHIHFVYFP